MAFSLAAHLSSSAVVTSATASIPTTNSLDKVHEELAKGNPLIYRLELNSKRDVIIKNNATRASQGKKALVGSISGLGGTSYLKTASTKQEGNLFTDVSLLPKIKDEADNWIDADNFLALVALSKGDATLTPEQIAENDFCRNFNKPLRHSLNAATLEERLITKDFIKAEMSILLRGSDFDEETTITTNEWIDSGNQDIKLYFNGLENFVSIQDLRESDGLLCIYFTLWNCDADAMLAPAKKAIPMPNGSLGLKWSLIPLAVTFEPNKWTSLKRPARVLDAGRSAAIKKMHQDLFAQPKAKQSVEVVPSSFFTEIVEYNLANVKTGSKGHHQFRDELFEAAAKGQWNVKAEKLLLDIGNSEKHTKFTVEQAQSIIAKAKNVMNEVLATASNTVKEVLEPAILELASESENDSDDLDLEPIPVMTNAEEFFAGVEEYQVNLNIFDEVFFSSEGE